MTKKVFVLTDSKMRYDKESIIVNNSNNPPLSRTNIIKSIILNERILPFVGKTTMFVLPTINQGFAIAVIKTTNEKRYIGTNGRMGQLIHYQASQNISFMACITAVDNVYNWLSKVDRVVVHTGYSKDALRAVRTMFVQLGYKAVVSGLDSLEPSPINPEKIENLGTMAFMAFYQALHDGRLFLKCESLTQHKIALLDEMAALRVTESKRHRLHIKSDELRPCHDLLVTAIALAFVC